MSEQKLPGSEFQAGDGRRKFQEESELNLRSYYVGDFCLVGGAETYNTTESLQQRTACVNDY
jgi:hypothetical protein